MNNQWKSGTLAACLVLAAATLANAQRSADPAALQRLARETGGTPAINAATGAVRFVRVLPARAQAPEVRGVGRSSMAEKQNRALSLLRRNAAAFGLGSAGEELVYAAGRTDGHGFTQLTFVQRYAGVPVFGARLRVHFDPSGAISAVNGTVVPDLRVSPAPRRDADDAARVAAMAVRMQSGAENLSVVEPTLMIFRAGLAKGVPGDNHLAWQVEVGNGAGVREFVYVDAHTGKIIDQITGIHDGMSRRAYDAQGATAPGPNYPANPYWVEGDAFPTASAEANNMLLASKDTYDLFWSAFGRDSFNAGGAIMDSIFNRGNSCPNASWNGIFISFCPGTTSDDVTAHEWGHAYTQYTHDLIYQWQPGALNESYSDIWGETVDLINGRGTDTPGGLRTAGQCTAFSPLPALVRINAPAAIAGDKLAGTAAFGPQSFNLTNDVVLADDGVGATADGCEVPWVNAGQVAGKIALVDRGTCGFAVKTKNAQLQGALGVIVANNTTGIVTMGGTDATIVVPALSILRTDGDAIKAQLLTTTVNATLQRGGTGSDNSVRWLMGEDATAFGGAIRDMWNPPCYTNPGKVTDTTYYVCGTGDGGGVHTNSGVPNHAFALLVDGGTYNGQTVGAIGLTKAAHIYYRAQTAYQVPTSDFADHADAIEASCSDLVGQNLNDLLTGLPSGEIISAGDCANVAKAALAVELRTPPTFCNFVPLLAPNPPARCAVGTTQVDHFLDDFEGGAPGWTASYQAVWPAEFTPRNWVLSALPDRAGTGFFGIDPTYGTCAAGGRENGVIHLTSPAFTVPTADSKLTFDHWVATEAGWDGGNLQVSVNGGAWQLVPQGAFSYNAYNATLNPAPGNDNPLAGQRAFTGTDGGSVEGSWGRSHVNLTGLAPAGASVRLRYQLGTDGCGGIIGWYVDDVNVYACISDTAPTVSVDDISVTEGDSGFSSGQFTISLSHPSLVPVTVKYKLFEGTAQRGTDWVPVNEDGNMEREVTIAPLSVSTTVPVRIKGDRRVEPDETYSLVIREVTNGTVGDDTGICTIVNDDLP